MNDKPHRVQLRRTKGWKMPSNTVKVARRSRWENPHPVGWCESCVKIHTRQEAIALFREAAELPNIAALIRAELRGKNLACFCPLDQPCHADVLLEIANR